MPNPTRTELAHNGLIFLKHLEYLSSANGSLAVCGRHVTEDSKQVSLACNMSPQQFPIHTRSSNIRKFAKRQSEVAFGIRNSF